MAMLICQTPPPAHFDVVGPISAIGAVVAAVAAAGAYFKQSRQVGLLMKDRDRERRLHGPFFQVKAARKTKARLVHLQNGVGERTATSSLDFFLETEEEIRHWRIGQTNGRSEISAWRVTKVIPVRLTGLLDLLIIYDCDGVPENQKVNIGSAVAWIAVETVSIGDWSLRFPRKAQGQRVSFMLSIELKNGMLEEQTYEAILGETLRRIDPVAIS
jgi:hypothetical protein